MKSGRTHCAFQKRDHTQIRNARIGRDASGLWCRFKCDESLLSQEKIKDIAPARQASAPGGIEPALIAVRQWRQVGAEVTPFPRSSPWGADDPELSPYFLGDPFVSSRNTKMSHANKRKEKRTGGSPALVPKIRIDHQEAALAHREVGRPVSRIGKQSNMNIKRTRLSGSAPAGFRARSKVTVALHQPAWGTERKAVQTG